MLLVSGVHRSKRCKFDGESDELTGLELLKVKRSVVPGITHVDYAARILTVDEERDGRYYRLLKNFKSKTGCPLFINTSFNIRGEPIVCNPENAYYCFISTNMDILVLEGNLLYKEEQPRKKEHKIDEYLAKFELD